MTNLNQLATNKDISEYGQACMCCGMSAIVSTYVGAIKLYFNLSAN
jgi:hypothetical protein